MHYWVISLSKLPQKHRSYDGSASIGWHNPTGPLLYKQSTQLRMCPTCDCTKYPDYGDSFIGPCQNRSNDMSHANARVFSTNYYNTDKHLKCKFVHALPHLFKNPSSLQSPQLSFPFTMYSRSGSPRFSNTVVLHWTPPFLWSHIWTSSKSWALLTWKSQILPNPFFFLVGWVVTTGFDYITLTSLEFTL